MIELITGNILEYSSGKLFHAILTDPPYELNFMNNQWDASGVAFRPETWAGLRKNLYPGGFGLAFASARGVHRMMTAIEDAGFIIHPIIFGWVFGSGFPKATRIDSQDNGASPFSSHRYGLQAMKPAIEPIVLFQNPYSGRPIDNMMATGAGALNIGEARLPADDLESRTVKESSSRGRSLSGSVDGSLRKEWEYDGDSGRWPANFFITHSHDCTETKCVCGADEMENRKFFLENYWHMEVYEMLNNSPLVKYQPKTSNKEKDAGLSALPLTTTDDGRNKPIDNPYLRGETERKNPHPTIKPIGLTSWLARLLLPPEAYEPRRILVPFSGVGSEVIGAYLAGWEEIVGVELDENHTEISGLRTGWWQMVSGQLGSTDVDKILEFARESRDIPDKQEDLSDLPLFRSTNE